MFFQKDKKCVQLQITKGILILTFIEQTEGRRGRRFGKGKFDFECHCPLQGQSFSFFFFSLNRLLKHILYFIYRDGSRRRGEGELTLFDNFSEKKYLSLNLLEY